MSVFFSVHMLSVTEGIQKDHSRVRFGENIPDCNSQQIKVLGASYLNPNKDTKPKHKSKTALG